MEQKRGAPMSLVPDTPYRRQVKISRDLFARLKNRLEYEGLNFDTFIVFCSNLLISEQESILEQLREFKAQNGIQSKNSRNKIAKELEKQREIDKKFIFSDEEINNIFDMILEEE